MGAVVADTHTAIWYLFRSSDLSAKALAVLRGVVEAGDPIFVASVSLVEATYLIEKGGLPRVALERLDQGLSGVDAAFVPVALDLTVARAVHKIPQDLVPDLPDRIIAATALTLDVPLVTCDRRLQAANIHTIW